MGFILTEVTHFFSAQSYLRETATFTAEVELFGKETGQEAKGSSSQARAAFGKAGPQNGPVGFPAWFSGS